MGEDVRAVYSVTELLQEAKGLLESKFPHALVSGEITNFKTASSGHMYFSLKDDQSQLDCVFFRGNSSGLAFKPEDGLQVVAGGLVTLYEARGRFQLNVRVLEPKGLGGLQLAFEQLKKKLAAEGLFEPGRKKPLPRFPRRVAVITSPVGAALQDFMRVLESRVGIEAVELFPVKVQGPEAPAEIAQAIREVSGRAEHDVLVVTRGGGSMEDLSAFNDEAVVRALAGCPIPTVSAVGHEVDFTLCDFVADQRAPTPTAAASLLAPGRDEMGSAVENYRQRLNLALKAVFERRQSGLKELLARLRGEEPSTRLDRARQDLDRMEEDLESSFRGLWEERKGRLLVARGFLARTSPQGMIKPLRQRAKSAGEELAKGFRRFLKDRLGEIRAMESRLNTLHPLAPLKRGYAVVTRVRTGKILRSAKGLEAGEKLHIRLGEGELKSKVVRPGEE